MKILVITPVPWDGTSFYRAHGIFPNLKKQLGGNLEIVQYYDRGFNYTWSDFLSFDVIFLQRPSLDAAKRFKLVEYAHKLGKKVWLDFDDNFFDVPIENRLHDDMTPTVKKAMFELINMADVVTVSTPALKEYFQAIKITSRIEVVPNAFNSDVLQMATKYNEIQTPIPPQKQKIKYLWRGSETHQGDLFDAAEAIVKTAQARPEIEWTFFGYRPWFITRYIESEFIRSGDIFDEYFPTLKQLAPQLVHFPLTENALNLSKSNICWIEATYAGSVCIAPDWREWDKPGVVKYSDMNHYESLLSQVILSNTYECWKDSRDFIMDTLTLDKVNKQRVEILKSL